MSSHRAIRSAFVLLAVTLGVGCPSGLDAQRATAVGPALVVYIQEFRGASPVADADLGPFMANLVRLELTRVPQANVRAAAPPAARDTLHGCPELPRGGERVLAAGREQRVYAISGAFEAGKPSAVTFLLARCGDQGPVALLPGRQSLTADYLLGDMLTVARTLTDRVDAERPRIGVKLEPIESGGSGPPDPGTLAPSLLLRLREALWDAGDLQPADTGVAYRIRGRVEVQGGAVSARAELLRAGEAMPLDSAIGGGPAEKALAVLDDVARKAVALIGQWRFVPVAGGPGADTVSVEGLLRRGQEALDAGNMAGAAGAAQAALARDSTNGDAYLLLGRAERARARPVEALTALERAATLAEQARGAGRPYERAWEHGLRLELAAVYQQVGNTEQAAFNLQRALQLGEANDSLIVAWSRTLRSADRPLEAIEALAPGLRADPVNAELRAEVGAALAGLTIPLVRGRTDRLVTACRVDPWLRSACANTLGLLARRTLPRPLRLALGTDVAAPAEELFTAVVALEPPEASTLAAASTYLAAFHVGTFVLTGQGNGSYDVALEGFDRDEAGRNLARAEALAPQTPDVLRRMIAGLRGQYDLALGDYEGTRAAARQAAGQHSIELNRDYLVVQADYLEARRLEERAQAAADSAPELVRRAMVRYASAADRARGLIADQQAVAYPYYRASIYALARLRGPGGVTDPLQVVTDAVERIVREDAEAGRELARVCVDQLHDYGCGYMVNAELTRARQATIVDTLNAVEVAFLAGLNPKGDSLLAVVNADSLAACDAPVARFYAFWSLSQRGAPAEAPSAFTAWRDALARQRAGLLQGPRCWIFDGALARLSAAPPPGAELLRAMIRAMQTRDAAVPAPPGGG